MGLGGEDGDWSDSRVDCCDDVMRKWLSGETRWTGWRFQMRYCSRMSAQIPDEEDGSCGIVRVAGERRCRPGESCC